MIILKIFIGIFILALIGNIFGKDNNSNIKQEEQSTDKNINTSTKTQVYSYNSYKTNNESTYNYEEYNYSKMTCDVCGEEISEEEYELNGGVCEDCYTDVNMHYQEYGLDDYTKEYKDLIDDWNIDEFDEEDDDYYNFDNGIDDFDEF